MGPLCQRAGMPQSLVERRHFLQCGTCVILLTLSGVPAGDLDPDLVGAPPSLSPLAASDAASRPGVTCQAGASNTFR
jgi:hypothetical protein